MRTIAGLILFAFLLFSCKQEKLNVPEPIKAVIANNSKNCTCDPFLDKYLWRNPTIYLSSCKGPACNCTTVYYDAIGKIFQMDSGYSPDQFRQEAQLVTHTWSCKP